MAVGSVCAVKMPETTAETGMAYGFADVSQATTTQNEGLDATPDAEINELQPTATSSVLAISAEANEKAGSFEADEESKMRFEDAFKLLLCRETEHENGYAAATTETTKAFRT